MHLQQQRSLELYCRLLNKPDTPISENILIAGDRVVFNIEVLNEELRLSCVHPMQFINFSIKTALSTLHPEKTFGILQKLVVFPDKLLISCVPKKQQSPQIWFRISKWQENFLSKLVYSL